MAEEKLEAKDEDQGPNLGPEEHSIKVYLSGNSGNKEVRGKGTNGIYYYDDIIISR